MKGEPFHYQQPGSRAQFATGMNGDEDLGQDIIMKGEPYHYNQKSLVQFATGMNGDEDLGQDITMKGEKFHYNQMVQLEGDGAAAAAVVPPPEKVSILDPKIAKTHTTFYGQK